MTLLFDALEDKKFDSRIIEKNLNRGVIAPADIEKSLASLPDDSENMEWVNVETLQDDQK